MELSDDAIDLLQSYNFPGNVRELENILERACTLCESNQITSDDLQLPQVETSAITVTAQKILLRISPVSNLWKNISNISKRIFCSRYSISTAGTDRCCEIIRDDVQQLRYRLQKLGLDRDE